MSAPVPPRRVPPSAPSPGEAAWRNGLFYFSALMGALALVDLDAGRVAQGMGDAGVAFLLLSLMSQFPFVRAVVTAGAKENNTQTRQKLLAEAERVRAENPWADRFSRTGWALLIGSLVLRIAGVN